MVMQPIFLDKLQAFRNHLAKPIIITSGYRSPEENKNVNGKIYHVQGLAIDCMVEGVSSEELAQEAIKFGFGGVGIYKVHTHIDDRPRLDNHIFTWDFR